MHVPLWSHLVWVCYFLWHHRKLILKLIQAITNKRSLEMDIVKAPVGAGSADLSVSGGSVIVSVAYPIEGVIDSALVGLEAKYPALAPEIAMLKEAIDAQLAKP